MIVRLSLYSLVLFIVACQGKTHTPQKSDESDTIAVEVAYVQPLEKAQNIDGTGRIEREREIDLSFRLDGKVTSFDLNEGDIISNGSFIAKIDDSQFKSRMNQAQTNYDQAKRELERNQKLAEGNWVSQQRVENLRAQVELARSEFVTAQFDQKWTRLYAPTQGTVLKRHIQSGEFVAAGKPIITLSDHASKLVARISLAERDVVKVKRGDTAELKISALPAKLFLGKISRIEPSIDALTGTADILIELSSSIQLQTGAMVSASIQPSSIPSTKHGITRIPAEAVIKVKEGLAQVYVVDSETQTAKVKEVNFLGFNNDYAEIKGLTVDEIVVTYGGSQLEVGSKLTYVMTTK